MSAGDLLTGADLRTLKEPARAWRNKWMALRPVRSSGGPVAPGTVLVSEETWPTKEIAEQAAIDCSAVMGVTSGLSVYLGPFPADEQP